MVDDSDSLSPDSRSNSSNSSSPLPPSFGLHIVRGKDTLTKVYLLLLHVHLLLILLVAPQSSAALAAMTKAELLQLLQQFEFPIAGTAMSLPSVLRTPIFQTRIPNVIHETHFATQTLEMQSNSRPVLHNNWQLPWILPRSSHSAGRNDGRQVNYFQAICLTRFTTVARALC